MRRPHRHYLQPKAAAEADVAPTMPGATRSLPLQLRALVGRPDDRAGVVDVGGPTGVYM